MVNRAAKAKIRKAILFSSLVTAVGLFSQQNVVRALEYTESINVTFTFNSALSISLSTDNLIIPNLAPGSAASSDPLTVTILTNNPAGYTLNATVGNSTTYNTRNLVHSNSLIDDDFAPYDPSNNLGLGANSPSGLDPNTWGISVGLKFYNIQAGTTTITFHNYRALPRYDDTENIFTIASSDGPVESASGDEAYLKLGAKASATQASGEYNNVINFQLTAAPVPTTLSMAFENAGKTKFNGYYKMQDMSSAICSAVEVEDESSEIQLIDVRDNKVYWVSKLQDGKCWMIQNLDLDIDSNTTYTHANTDLGYGTSANQTWTPDKSTYTTGTTTWDTTDAIGSVIQQSYDPGDMIWDGITDSNNNTNLNNMTQGTDWRYHIGNYYNWGAAVAMNNTSGINTSDTNVDQSICPAGWTLPTDNGYEQDIDLGKVGYLITLYGWEDHSTPMTDPYPYSSPLYFTLGGRWSGVSDLVASYAIYWASTSDGQYAAIGYNVDDAGIFNPGYNGGIYRRFGGSIRCVSR